MKGAASPSIKDGRYSKYLPAGLYESYGAMMEGEAARLPELDNEIALAWARKQELLTRIPSGEAAGAWQKLTAAYDAMQEATESDERQKQLTTVLRILERRRHDYMVWADIDRTTEQIRRLTESQNRIMQNREATYTAEEMLLLLMNVAGIIRRRVSDKNEVKAVGRDLDAIALRDVSGVSESRR